MNEIDSLQWWVHAMNLGTVSTVALSLLFGGVGFFLNKRLGELKDAKSDRELRESSEKIAASNERIAELDAQRAAAEQEVARIKEGMKARVLSKDQIQAIGVSLAQGEPVHIFIGATAQDTDTQQFAQQVAEAIGKGGWQVSYAWNVVASTRWGLSLHTDVGKMANAERVQRALATAGMKVDLVQTPEIDTLRLYVGSKAKD